MSYLLNSCQSFLNLNAESIFVCEVYDGDCKMILSECVRRQELAQAALDGNGGVRKSQNLGKYDYSRCLNCERGRENIKIANKEVIKVEVPEKFEADQTKKCICGKIFVRPDYVSRFWWRLRVYCPECRDLPQSFRYRSDGADLLLEVLIEELAEEV